MPVRYGRGCGVIGALLGAPMGLKCCVYAGVTPASSFRVTNSFNIAKPPSSLHALSTTCTAAWRCPG